MKSLVQALGLFTVTALAEICGCYTFYMWLTLKHSPMWLLPGVASLVLFAWLLTLHPTVAGRTYAASLAWLKFVDGQSPDRWDFIGAQVCLTGAAIILFPHIKLTTAN